MYHLCFWIPVCCFVVRPEVDVRQLRGLIVTAIMELLHCLPLENLRCLRRARVTGQG